MQGDPGVLDYLERAIRAELQAISQYSFHARVLDNLGYRQMVKQWYRLVDEERGHFDKFLDRATLLSGWPDMTQDPVDLGRDIPSILAKDKAGEETAIKLYTKAASVCNEQGDYVSRDIFALVLADEQEHLNFHETQLSLIKDIGLELYANRVVGHIKLRG